MSNLYRRCGCRTEQGKQYPALPERATSAQKSRACPLMLSDAKHGRWSYRLSGGTDPVTGKRVQVNGRSYASKREAQQARNVDAAKLDRGVYVKPSRKTLAVWLDEWLQRRQRTDRALRPATLENYQRYIAQDIAPSPLGRMRLEDIKRPHIVAFIDALAESGRGAVTVRRIVAVLQGALSAAVSAQLIDHSPATRLGDVLPRVERERFQPWTPEQVGTFLDTAAEHRLGPLFELAVLTGLRRSELVGLRWTDVDLAHGVIYVRESKTDAGVRRVDLDDRSAGALLAWELTQQAEAAAWGDAWLDSGHVFTMEDGSRVKAQYATRLFDKLRVKAGLPEMTLHGLRHMHAALMIASGAGLSLVSKRLGHSSISITSDTYVHLVGSASRDAANGAAALVPKGRRAHTVHTSRSEAAEEAVPNTAGTASDLHLSRSG